MYIIEGVVGCVWLGLVTTNTKSKQVQTYLTLSVLQKVSFAH